MTKSDSNRLTGRMQRIITEQGDLLVNQITREGDGAQAAGADAGIALIEKIAATPEGLMLLEIGGWNVVACDPEMAALLGVAPGENSSWPLGARVDLAPAELTRRLGAALAGDPDAVGALLFKRGDNTEIELHVRAIPLRVAGQGLLALQLRDNRARQKVLAELQDSEQKYRMLFESSPETMWVYDIETLRILAVNQTAINAYGYSQAEFLALTLKDLRPAEDVPALEKWLAKRDTDRPSYWRHRRKDGTFLRVSVAAHSIQFAGRPARLVAARDITRLLEAEAGLQEKEQLYQAVFETAADAFIITDPKGNVVHINRAFTRLFGFDPEELLGRNLHPFIVPEEDLPAAKASLEHALKGDVVDFAALRKRKDGSVVEVEIRGSAVTLSGSPHLLGRYTDITERRAHEQQIETLAFQDSLTRLPNRFRLGMLLEQALHQARLARHPLAVLFMDLDRFKTVNDSLGHSAGDALLAQTAERIRSALREHDLYGRLGGDEFLVILPKVGGAADAEAIANRILRAMKAPFTVGTHNLYTSISIGISLFPDDGTDVEQLIKNADAAMYRAKEKGRDTSVQYSPAITAQNLANLALESELHRSLETGEMKLHYQPVVTAASGRIAGFEALLRWQHPEQGLLNAAQFIGLAEATGFTVQMAPWILAEAAQQIRDWRRLAEAPLSMSINLTARQFQKPDLAARIRAALELAGLGPGALTLEITESSAMQNIDAAIVTLREIKALGCKIAIDDFGTGYSSLSYLKRLPIDIVKIDQSFIHDLTTDPDDAAITTAVIAMAHGLNLQVVAEGVETQAQLDFLRTQRCDFVQGYLFGQALSPEEMTAQLTKPGGLILD